MTGWADQIRNEHGERLDTAFAAGRGLEHRNDWLVVLGHGVTGDKDRPVIVDTAHALNEGGFDTLRFSFAGNGASDGDFRAATISKEVGDLQAVVAAAAARYPGIGYIGHSMGAAVGVLAAARDHRITSLVSIAGMVDTGAFAKREFGNEVPDQGVMWEDPACPLSSAFMNDLCQTVGTVEPAAAGIRIPWLLVHGSIDDVVPSQDSRSIKKLKGSAVELVIVDGADHVFSRPHHQQELASLVVRWFQAAPAAA